jgi:hypothetical protein
MAGPPKQSSDLSSWKEIATHLGVSVRAAQKWERERSLPVQRLPGKRSGVSASVADLVAWRESGAPVVAARGGTRRRVIQLALVLLLLTTAGLILSSVLRRPLPATYKVQDGALVVLDGAGRELWRASFSEPLVASYYEGMKKDGRSMFWTGDLGHGRVVLFVVPTSPHGSSFLICFSDRGTEQWRFQPGRPVASTQESFANVFRVEQFLVAPLGPDGAPEIIVSSVQVPYYPDQVAVLSPERKVLGEYWHSGYLTQIAVVGRDIYLAGTNNAYRAATLVVLDADHVSGASVEEDLTHQLLGFAPAHEKARILFPRTCINRTAEQQNAITTLSATPESVTVIVAERLPPSNAEIWYHLTPALQLVRANPTDAFRTIHAELRLAHQLDHDFTPKEEAELANIRVIRPHR